MKTFSLAKLPAIVGCITPKLPSATSPQGSPFARIDDQGLLTSPSRADTVLKTLYDYLISDNFASALKVTADAQSLKTKLKLGLIDFGKKLGAKLAADFFDYRSALHVPQERVIIDSAQTQFAPA